LFISVDIFFNYLKKFLRILFSALYNNRLGQDGKEAVWPSL